MKKITQSATTGGAPIYLDDFKDVFNKEIWDVLEGILSGFNSVITEGIIVSGCLLTGSPGNYTLSAGIVYLDGEFLRVPESTGLSLPQYIIPATDVNTTRTFEDTVIKTLFITKSAELSATETANGQYIALTTAADSVDRRLTGTLTKILSIGDWNMTLTPLVGVAHGISDFTKIRSVTAMIRNDANTVLIPYSDNFDGVTTTEVSLTTSAPFDSDVNYNATGYNRGWVTIIYEA
jgi:hypothetical protein